MREKDRLIRDLEQLADEWEDGNYEELCCALELREVLADYE